MGEIMRNPHSLDVVLLVVALEGLWYARRRARGEVFAGGLTATLAAGACLVFAMRASVAGMAWGWIALGLAGALVAHCVDVSGRLPAPGRRGGRREGTGIAPALADIGGNGIDRV